MADGFDAAVAELSRLHEESDPTGPLLDAIPMSGASVSTLGNILGQETVAASDSQAARIDEIQFDLGEGPCWTALRSGQPVLEPDIRAHPQHPYPAFSAAMKDEAVGAVFAFPLSIGTLHVGALDFYSDTPRDLPSTSVEQARVMADILGRWVLRRALHLTGEVDGGAANPHSRRVIHQATGFVIAQLGVSAEDAHLLIQAHAIAQERSMSEIAGDIVSRQLVFRMREDRIEEHT